MRVKYRPIFSKKLNWVYKKLNAFKNNNIKNVYIVYKGTEDIPCRYSYSSLIKHKEFMINLYRNIKVRKLFVEI